ncbi:MAG: HD domain-containing protein [Mariniphaga sp.]|nr:HD domain-containing protein [Mariniphaga sp.]
MENEHLLKATENFVKSVLEGESSGHDWWHIHRVRNLALMIAKSEGADLFVVELAALLHDIDDWKLIEAGGEEQKTKTWLRNCNVGENVAERICNIIEGVSFKGAGVNTSTNDIECKALQDADRLDAIGAVGIARTFAYGGNRGRGIYDPEIQPEMHTDFENYKKSNAPTINHFYEKLLLLKDQMQTKMGRNLAEQRHDFMILFLNQFYDEWNGKLL